MGKKLTTGPIIRRDGIAKDWIENEQEQDAGSDLIRTRLLQSAKKKIRTEDTRVRKIKDQRLRQLALRWGFVTKSGSPNWRRLAMRLAEECRFEFRVAYPSSRPGPKPKASFELFDAVEEKRMAGMRISTACRWLSTQPGWQGRTQKELEAQYRRERLRKKTRTIMIDFSGARKKERR